MGFANLAASNMYAVATKILEEILKYVLEFEI